MYVFTLSLFQELATVLLIAVFAPLVLAVLAIHKRVRQRRRRKALSDEAFLRERARINAEAEREEAERAHAEEMAAIHARHERNFALWIAAYEARWASIMNCYGGDYYEHARNIGYWGEDGNLSYTYGHHAFKIERLHKRDEEDIRRRFWEALHERQRAKTAAELREFRESSRLHAEAGNAEMVYFAQTYGRDAWEEPYSTCSLRRARLKAEMKELMPAHSEEEARAIVLARWAEQEREAELGRLRQMADDAEAAWYLNSFGREAYTEEHRAAVRAAKLAQISRLVGEEHADEFLARAYPELA